MKSCSTCGELKDESNFQRRKASKDGLTSSCKSCLNERDARRYVRERERRTARYREYIKTPAGREAHSKAIERWRQANQVRRAAHIILGNAVRDGRVQPLPCLECGGKAEAHHPDYDRPLDVIWLCTTHHKETHRMREANQ